MECMGAFVLSPQGLFDFFLFYFHWTSSVYCARDFVSVTGAEVDYVMLVFGPSGVTIRVFVRFTPLNWLPWMLHRLRRCVLTFCNGPFREVGCAVRRGVAVGLVLVTMTSGVT